MGGCSRGTPPEGKAKLDTAHRQWKRAPMSCSYRTWFAVEYATKGLLVENAEMAFRQAQG